MIEGLVFGWVDIFGNGFILFFGIGEFWIDIDYYVLEREEVVMYYVVEIIFGLLDIYYVILLYLV